MPSTLLTFRAPTDLVAQLDELTTRTGAATRSELIRALIADALTHDGLAAHAVTQARTGEAIAILQSITNATQGDAHGVT